MCNPDQSVAEDWIIENTVENYQVRHKSPECTSRPNDEARSRRYFGWRHLLGLQSLIYYANRAVGQTRSV